MPFFMVNLRMRLARVAGGLTAAARRVSRRRLSARRDDRADSYVMNADGSGQTRLTTDRLPDFTPAWQATAP